MKKLLVVFLAVGWQAFAQCPASFTTMAPASPNLSGSMDSKVCGLSGAGAPTAAWCTTALIGKATYTNTANGDTYACTANLTWTLKGAQTPLSVAPVAVLSTDTTKTVSYGFTLTDGALATPSCRLDSNNHDIQNWTDVTKDTTSMTFTWSGTAGFNMHCGPSISGAPGPAGPTGPAGSGTIGTGSNPQMAQYNASGVQIVKAVTMSGDATIADGGAVTIANSAITTAKINPGAVTSAKQSVEPTRRTICIPIGSKNAASALTDNDLADSDLYFLPAAGTLVEVSIRADNGTPNIILGRDRAGSVVNLTSTALATAASGGVACSNTGGTTGLNGVTACSATLQNTGLNVGDWILPVSGTSGGTAKQVTACLTWVTVN